MWWILAAIYFAGFLATSGLYFRRGITPLKVKWCSYCDMRPDRERGCYHRTQHEIISKEEQLDRTLGLAWASMIPGIVWPLSVLPLLILGLTPLTPAESRAKIQKLQEDNDQLERELGLKK